MPLGDDLGMKARVEPEVERSAQRQVTQDLERAVEKAEDSFFDDGLGGGFQDRTMPSGGRGGGGGVGTDAAGAAAGGRLLGGGVGGAAKFLGTVALGGIVANRMYEAMSSASGKLGAVNSMFGQASKLFIGAFGDKVAEALLPFAREGLKMATRFREISNDESLTVGIGWLAGEVAETLAPDLDIGDNFGGTFEGGAPSEDLRTQDLGDTIASFEQTVSDLKDWLEDRESGVGGNFGGPFEGGAPSEDLRTQDLNETITSMKRTWGSFEESIASFDLDDYVSRIEWWRIIDPVPWAGIINAVPWQDIIDGIDLGNLGGGRDTSSTNDGLLDRVSDGVDDAVDTVTGDDGGGGSTPSADVVTGIDEGESISDAFDTVGLAEGGVVSRPTTARLGEAGPEAVVPLDDLESGGDSREVARMLKELLQAVEQQTEAIRRESDVTVETRLDVDGKRLADTVTKAQNRFIASRESWQ